MENVITSLSNVIKYLQEKNDQILELTDFEFLKSFSVIATEPLEVKIADGLIYKPIRNIKFNNLIAVIAKQYSMPLGFLQDWLLYLISAITTELESRLEFLIEHHLSELDDIFDKTRKLHFIEENLTRLKILNESVLLPQGDIYYYRQNNFDLTSKSLSELMFFILNGIDGIIDTCLEIHYDTLNHIFLNDKPTTYYDEEFSIGSEHIENFIKELTKYHEYCFLREIATFIQSSGEYMTQIELPKEDQRFLLEINPLLSRAEYGIIIDEILKSITTRSISFFSNLFTYLKSNKKVKPFFKDVQPAEYIKLVKKNYPQLNFKRVVTHNTTETFIQYFEKAIDNYLYNR